MEESIRLIKQVIRVTGGVKGQDCRIEIEDYLDKKYNEKDQKGVLYTGKILSANQMAKDKEKLKELEQKQNKCFSKIEEKLFTKPKSNAKGKKKVKKTKKEASTSSAKDSDDKQVGQDEGASNIDGTLIVDDEKARLNDGASHRNDDEADAEVSEKESDSSGNETIDDDVSAKDSEDEEELDGFKDKIFKSLAQFVDSSLTELEAELKKEFQARIKEVAKEKAIENAKAKKASSDQQDEEAKLSNIHTKNAIFPLNKNKILSLDKQKKVTSLIEQTGTELMHPIINKDEKEGQEDDKEGQDDKEDQDEPSNIEDKLEDNAKEQAEDLEEYAIATVMKNDGKSFFRIPTKTDRQKMKLSMLKAVSAFCKKQLKVVTDEVKEEVQEQVNDVKSDAQNKIQEIQGDIKKDVQFDGGEEEEEKDEEPKVDSPDTAEKIVQTLTEPTSMDVYSKQPNIIQKKINMIKAKKQEVLDKLQQGIDSFNKTVKQKEKVFMDRIDLINDVIVQKQNEIKQYVQVAKMKILEKVQEKEDQLIKAAKKEAVFANEISQQVIEEIEKQKEELNAELEGQLDEIVAQMEEPIEELNQEIAEIREQMEEKLQEFYEELKEKEAEFNSAVNKVNKQIDNVIKQAEKVARAYDMILQYNERINQITRILCDPTYRYATWTCLTLQLFNQLTGIAVLTMMPYVKTTHEMVEAKHDISDRYVYLIYTASGVIGAALAPILVQKKFEPKSIFVFCHLLIGVALVLSGFYLLKGSQLQTIIFVSVSQGLQQLLNSILITYQADKLNASAFGLCNSLKLAIFIVMNDNMLTLLGGNSHTIYIMYYFFGFFQVLACIIIVLMLDRPILNVSNSESFSEQKKIYKQEIKEIIQAEKNGEDHPIYSNQNLPEPKLFGAINVKYTSYMITPYYMIQLGIDSFNLYKALTIGLSAPIFTVINVAINSKAAFLDVTSFSKRLGNKCRKGKNVPGAQNQATIKEMMAKIVMQSIEYAALAYFLKIGMAETIALFLSSLLQLAVINEWNNAYDLYLQDKKISGPVCKFEWYDKPLGDVAHKSEVDGPDCQDIDFDESDDNDQTVGNGDDDGYSEVPGPIGFVGGGDDQDDAPAGFADDNQIGQDDNDGLLNQVNPGKILSENGDHYGEVAPIRININQPQIQTGQIDSSSDQFITPSNVNMIPKSQVRSNVSDDGESEITKQKRMDEIGRQEDEAFLIYLNKCSKVEDKNSFNLNIFNLLGGHVAREEAKKREEELKDQYIQDKIIKGPGDEPDGTGGGAGDGQPVEPSKKDTNDDNKKPVKPSTKDTNGKKKPVDPPIKGKIGDTKLPTKKDINDNKNKPVNPPGKGKIGDTKPPSTKDINDNKNKPVNPPGKGKIGDTKPPSAQDINDNKNKPVDPLGKNKIEDTKPPPTKDINDNKNKLVDPPGKGKIGDTKPPPTNEFNDNENKPFDPPGQGEIGDTKSPPTKDINDNKNKPVDPPGKGKVEDIKPPPTKDINDNKIPEPVVPDIFYQKKKSVGFDQTDQNDDENTVDPGNPYGTEIIKPTKISPKKPIDQKPIYSDIFYKTEQNFVKKNPISPAKKQRIDKIKQGEQKDIKDGDTQQKVQSCPMCKKNFTLQLMPKTQQTGKTNNLQWFCSSCNKFIDEQWQYKKWYTPKYKGKFQQKDDKSHQTIDKVISDAYGLGGFDDKRSKSFGTLGGSVQRAQTGSAQQQRATTLKSNSKIREQQQPEGRKTEIAWKNQSKQ